MAWLYPASFIGPPYNAPTIKQGSEAAGGAVGSSVGGTAVGLGASVGGTAVGCSTTGASVGWETWVGAGGAAQAVSINRADRMIIMLEQILCFIFFSWFLKRLNHRSNMNGQLFFEPLLP